jgi:hypothetical protein
MSSNWKIALVLLLPSFSESLKKSEYEDEGDIEEVDEATESGDEESDLSEALKVKRFSGGNSTAMVPPKVGLLDSPHILEVV